MSQAACRLQGSTEPPVGHTETFFKCKACSSCCLFFFYHSLPLFVWQGNERNEAEESGKDDVWFTSDFSKLLTVAFAYLEMHIIAAIKKQTCRLCLWHIKTDQANAVILLWIIDLTDRMIYILWVIWVSLFACHASMKAEACIKIQR